MSERVPKKKAPDAAPEETSLGDLSPKMRADLRNTLASKGVPIKTEQVPYYHGANRRVYEDMTRELEEAEERRTPPLSTETPELDKLAALLEEFKKRE